MSCNFHLLPKTIKQTEFWSKKIPGAHFQFVTSSKVKDGWEEVTIDNSNYGPH